MGLSPFMEIKQWDRIRLSVEESARRLQRIAYLDRCCLKIEAGHMIARPEYEVKGALGRLLWQDAEHHTNFAIDVSSCGRVQLLLISVRIALLRSS